MSETLIADAAPAQQGTESPAAPEVTDAAPQQNAPVEGAQEVKAEAATDDAKPAGAPEVYEDFKVPEGKTLQPDFLDDLKAAAKELNLSQDAAQKLVDLALARGDKGQAQADAMKAKAIADWEAQVKADQEIGGDKLDVNLGVAKTALKEFGTPELKHLLDETGLGSHPEVIKFFVKAGKAISQDNVVTGKAPAPGGRRDLAQALYG